MTLATTCVRVPAIDPGAVPRVAVGELGMVERQRLRFIDVATIGRCFGRPLADFRIAVVVCRTRAQSSDSIQFTSC
jgi:hypothetical protein